MPMVLTGLLTSCQSAFTMTTECCGCCHGMTKDIIPFSHIGSKNNRNKDMCDWRWRDCFSPRSTQGSHSEICSVEHSIWMLQDAGFLRDVYPTSSSEETSLLLQRWLCQLLARSFKSNTRVSGPCLPFQWSRMRTDLSRPSWILACKCVYHRTKQNEQDFPFCSKTRVLFIRFQCLSHERNKRKSFSE